MHEYDVALKRILTRPGSALLAALTGSDTAVRWLNVETPLVRNLRVDMMGQLDDSGLIEIEFQSRNEKGLPMRMGEYLFAGGRTHGQLPRQIVLYVGDAPMRMKNRIETPDLSFRFHLVDVRDLDGEALLASRNLGDNIIAILTKLGTQRDTVRRILERIANGPVEEREERLAELLILSGLRRLTGRVIRETKRMPIHYDIMDDQVLGPMIRRAQAKEKAKGLAEGRVEGRQEGRVEGRQEGRVEGRQEGQLEILMTMLEKRFGSVPPRVKKRLAELKPNQIKAAGLRLLDAQRVDDVFAR